MYTSPRTSSSRGRSRPWSRSGMERSVLRFAVMSSPSVPSPRVSPWVNRPPTYRSATATRHLRLDRVLPRCPCRGACAPARRTLPAPPAVGVVEAEHGRGMARRLEAGQEPRDHALSGKIEVSGEIARAPRPLYHSGRRAEISDAVRTLTPEGARGAEERSESRDPIFPLSACRAGSCPASRRRAIPRHAQLDKHPTRWRGWKRSTRGVRKLLGKDNVEYAVEPKVDGVAVALRYVGDGSPRGSPRRRDGGDDITAESENASLHFRPAPGTRPAARARGAGRGVHGVALLPEDERTRWTQGWPPS